MSTLSALMRFALRADEALLRNELADAAWLATEPEAWLAMYVLPVRYRHSADIKLTARRFLGGDMSPLRVYQRALERRQR
jgi:hypothetical protein